MRFLVVGEMYWAENYSHNVLHLDKEKWVDISMDFIKFKEEVNILDKKRGIELRKKYI